MLDRVCITKDDYINMANNVNTLLKEHRYYFDYIFKPKQVSLNAFELLVGVYGFKYRYDIETGELQVSFETKKSGKLKFVSKNVQADFEHNKVLCDIDYEWRDAIQPMNWQLECWKSEYEYKTLSTEFVKVFYLVNFYMLNIPTIYRETKEKTEETYVENKKGDKRYKSRVVLRRVVYFKPVKPMSKNAIKHLIKCLCWGVRGHERHLKNGTIVWVKPYRKGKERNNPNAYVPKEYSL